ncbi:MAG: hypothetical protein SOW20_07835 [Berryella intestinalis]|uniref:hypothetical protein n=1 Tax=Berryella intestinalis TaxID=1531429 RepID=UPI002A766439|nr:hypothetical protein [Berryella intestinalis]MDY3129914.1 hypothetical protein [Berryella intestinalis]
MEALAMFGAIVLMVMMLMIVGFSAYLGWVIAEAMHDCGMLGWLDRIIERMRR